MTTTILNGSDRELIKGLCDELDRYPINYEFGKGDLRCKAVSAFRQIIKGYRWSYGIDAQTEEVAA